MRGRLGPVNGYDTGAKRHYRRTIWRAFRDHFKGQVADRHVLLMPSKEGDEIETALANGFREHNLHVVDWNPAIVAHLKRRYPRINTYGIELERAAQRMLDDDGPLLSAANLDLTYPLGQKTVRIVSRFIRDAPLDDEGLVAITMLRGREQCIDEIRRHGRDVLDGLGMLPSSRSHIPDLGTEDLGRLEVFALLLHGFMEHVETHALAPLWLPRLWRAGMYRSPNGVQTLLWGVFVMKMWEDLHGDYRELECDIQSGRFVVSARGRAFFDTEEEAVAFTRAARLVVKKNPAPNLKSHKLWMRT